MAESRISTCNIKNIIIIITLGMDNMYTILKFLIEIADSSFLLQRGLCASCDVNYYNLGAVYVLFILKLF